MNTRTSLSASMLTAAALLSLLASSVASAEVRNLRQGKARDYVAPHDVEVGAPGSVRRLNRPLFDIGSNQHQRKVLDTYIIDPELKVPFQTDAFEVIQFADTTETNDNPTDNTCFPLQPLEAKPVSDAACLSVHPCTVGPTLVREWLGYMFQAPEQDEDGEDNPSRRFRVTIRVASSVATAGASPKRVRIEVGNSDSIVESSGDLLVDATTTSYTNISFDPQFSETGLYLLRVTFLDGGVDMCSLSVSFSGLPIAQQSNVLLIPTTASVIEDYTAFSDTNTNSLGNCKNELDVRTPVDATTTGLDGTCTGRDDATCAIAFTVAGEWLDYEFATPSAVSARAYTLLIRASSTSATDRIRVDVKTPRWNQTATLITPGQGANGYADISAPFTLPPDSSIQVRLTFLNNDIRVCSLRIESADLSTSPSVLELASIPIVPTTLKGVDYVDFEIRDPEVARTAPSCPASDGVVGPFTATVTSGDNACDVGCYLTEMKRDDVLYYNFRLPEEASDLDDDESYFILIRIRMAGPDNANSRFLDVTIDGNDTFRYLAPQNGFGNFQVASSDFRKIADPDLAFHQLKVQFAQRNVQICSIEIEGRVGDSDEE